VGRLKQPGSGLTVARDQLEVSDAHRIRLASPKL
jgi:hypothetical protein